MKPEALFNLLYQSHFRNTLLALSFAPLLAALAVDMHNVLFTRGLMSLHVILFIVWHPYWLGHKQLRAPSSAAFLILGGAQIVLSFPIVTACWLVFLASLLAGEPFKRGKDILAQGLSIIFLLTCLFIFALPASFQLHIDPTTTRFIAIVLSIVLLALGLMSQEPKLQNIRQTDVLLSILFAQVVVLTGLGTLVFVLYRSSHYLSALLYSLIGATLLLIILNVLWKLFTGSSALSFLWNRYLLIIGSPFENLLMKFSALAKTTQSPSRYLEICFGELIQLDWLAGVRWRAASGNGKLGEKTDHSLSIDIADLSIKLYGRQALHGSLAVHARLLVHMITHFYHSIKRERSLAHRAHVQAVYETGARLTHDIKNLLQGMKTLSAAGENTSDPVAFHRLFTRQIPTINERLETTLRKLTEPNTEQEESHILLSVWWKSLKQRYQGRNITLSAAIDVDHHIPDELFNTVSENLLENARAKRLHDRDIKIDARLIANSDGIIFSVVDTGYPVDADTAQYLLSEPVKSEQGLGVGLYQSAALAKHEGYELSLETNVEGMVCFTLAQQPSA